MSRIGGTPGPLGPPDPGRPEPTSKTDGVSRAAPVGGPERAQAPQEIGGAERLHGPPRTELANQIQELILRGAQRAESREELLRNTVRLLAERAYGDAASDGMVASIVETVERDPQLSSLFSQLCRVSLGKG